jgi:hypothetical protein
MFVRVTPSLTSTYANPVKNSQKMLIFFLSGRPLLQLYMWPDESVAELCGPAERDAAMECDDVQDPAPAAAKAAWEQTAGYLGTVMTEIAQFEQKSAESPDFVSTPTSTGRLIERKWQYGTTK